MAAAAAEGMPAPLRPTKELYQEKSLNLADAWARVYLARGCGAVVHSRVGEFDLLAGWINVYRELVGMRW
jgi:hypothetical protein